MQLATDYNQLSAAYGQPQCIFFICKLSCQLLLQAYDNTIIVIIIIRMFIQDMTFQHKLLLSTCVLINLKAKMK